MKKMTVMNLHKQNPECSLKQEGLRLYPADNLLFLILPGISNNQISFMGTADHRFTLLHYKQSEETKPE
jgi:hypothetical protein